jgi:hypothetical protein
MLFESTTILLGSIVHSIENNGEVGWDDHLESGNQCLYELHQLARSSARTYKSSNAKFPVVTPAFERAICAIPHVKSMMRSIRTKDQAAAVESGRAAMAAMNGTIAAAHSNTSVEPKSDSRQPANAPAAPAKKVHRYQEPVKQKRVPVAMRKPVRVSTAGSK